MNTAAISQLTQAVQAAYRVAQSDLSACDVEDIEELIEPIYRELESRHPNKSTLATFLNSLARSLRTDPAARDACNRLDSAMRTARIETHWRDI
jgi:hypothetical protein